MRLDHLLSKEYTNARFVNSGQQGPFALFDFEDAEFERTKKDKGLRS